MKENISQNFKNPKPSTEFNEDHVLPLAMQHAENLMQLFHEKSLRQEEIMGLYILLDPEVQEAITSITETKINQGMSEDDALMFFQDQVEKSSESQFCSGEDLKPN